MSDMIDVKMGGGGGGWVGGWVGDDSDPNVSSDICGSYISGSRLCC